MFTKKRMQQIFDSLNPAEEERYSAFREAFGIKLRAKVENVSNLTFIQFFSLF
jgi:hypothetical protein